MACRRHLANEKMNFAFETTLASKTFATWISSLKQQGYYFHLVYLWLESPELAFSRVAERVKSEVDILCLKLNNFFNLYQPITDSWQFYNNSELNSPRLIAPGAGITISKNY